MPHDRRLLIVDDDEIFLFTAGYALNRAFPGIQIVTSRNGEDALDRLRDGHPEVLFVDLNMPLMNGWELLDALSEKFDTLPFPVFIVTSSIDPGDKTRAEEHPLHPGFLEKPLTEEKLKSLELKIGV